MFAVALWNFGVNGGNPLRLFLLTGLEFNNSNRRPRQSGRFYFLSAGPRLGLLMEGLGVGRIYMSLDCGCCWSPGRLIS